MDKLKMQSPNKVDKNIESIGKLFPNCLVEAKNEKGEIEQAIDFDLLRQELSKNIVEGNKERYQFTWPDKKKSILLANSPIEKTLRPCREESVDFDNTENLYIEGDNLDVLKLLQETYLNKVKMIYIDPPYNTGNDFVYEDNFAKSEKEHSENSGEYDDEGNRLYENKESFGKFHTNWLNMIYPRIKVAKDLLTDDGVIFISIDDHEVENLKKICNEIFGEKNFVGEIIRKTKSMTGDDGSGFNLQHENLLIFSKDKKNIYLLGNKKEFGNYLNPDNDSNGEWCSGDPSAKSGGKSTYFPIENPHTKRIDLPPKGRYWAFSKNTLKKYTDKGKIIFKKNYKENERGFIFKRYRNDAKSLNHPVNSLLAIGNEYMNQSATIELKNIFGSMYFIYPKPVKFLYELISCIATNNNDIILDFFSGSATTAHAVMKLNAEDSGNRKFIMVQVPEKTDEKSEAYKAGYKNICEIGKDRIRLAGKKIVEELKEKKKDNKLFDKEDNYKLDTGFRVLKLDSTNMKDVYYDPSKYTPELFSSLTDNIKGDRTPEDLLFQVMLELGVPLSYKIEETTVNEKKVFNVNSNYLIACFDDNITDKTVTYIAKLRPQYAVFRDSSMANDSVATNFEQLFKTYSPETIRKVL